MNVDVIKKKIIRILNNKIIKLILTIFEAIIYWYCNKISKKGKKINDNLFGFFQIFSQGKLYTLRRRQLYAILINNLDKNSEKDKKIYSLINKSYVKLFDINQTDVESTVEYFYNQKIYNSHVPINEDFPNKLIKVEEFLNTKEYHYGSFDIKTSLKSVVVKKICLMQPIWEYAKKCLNSNNVEIYSINTMLSKKSEQKNYVVNIHRDNDCASSLTFFVYWTDVSKLNGATKIIPGTHLFLPDRNVNNYIGEPLIEYIEGSRGSVFAIDTWALHAGNVNLTTPRLVTWIRFSSMPVKTYYLDNNYLFREDLNEINQQFK